MLKPTVAHNTTYRFLERANGDGYDVQKVIDGKACPGCMGKITGRTGSWLAEWVDGSRIGFFQTPKDAAKAMDGYLAVICN